MTILDWVEYLTQTVWNVCRTLKTVFYRSKIILFLMENSVEKKYCKNRE